MSELVNRRSSSQRRGLVHSDISRGLEWGVCCMMSAAVRSIGYWAAGLVIGALLGLPFPAYILIAFGVWTGLVFIAPVPAIFGGWRFVRRRGFAGLGLLLAGNIFGFAIVFWYFGIHPGEGYPRTALIAGIWMAMCLVATGSTLILRLERALERRAI